MLAGVKDWGEGSGRKGREEGREERARANGELTVLAVPSAYGIENETKTPLDGRFTALSRPGKRR